MKYQWTHLKKEFGGYCGMCGGEGCTQDLVGKSWVKRQHGKFRHRQMYSTGTDIDQIGQGEWIGLI